MVIQLLTIKLYSLMIPNPNDMIWYTYHHDTEGIWQEVFCSQEEELVLGQHTHPLHYVEVVQTQP